jgi:hypothetical protein
MSKYEALGQFLRGQARDHLPMTFAEIEKILGLALPPSKLHRAWWSNNPSNNVMTRQWLDAGYETESVDIGSGKLVFRRVANSSDGSGGHQGLHPIFGCMKGMVTFAEGYDPAAPTGEDWDDAYLGGDRH